MNKLYLEGGVWTKKPEPVSDSEIAKRLQEAHDMRHLQVARRERRELAAILGTMTRIRVEAHSKSDEIHAEGEQ